MLPDPKTNGAGSYEKERAELETLLASGVFARAPNLADILSYVCNRYFQGQSDQIKEYNIAVEALGRPAAFDQKEDAIVRVEAHRLRKRLQQYYENEGADRPIQISIPLGQYVPVFTARPGTAALVSTRRRWRLWAPAIAAGVVLAGIALFTARLSTWTGNASSRAPEVKVKAAVPQQEELRLLAGFSGPKYIDSLGNTWLQDRHSTGGTVISSGALHPISGTQDPSMFRTKREGDFQYDIPLKPGTYELRLLFAETAYGAGNLEGGGETSRLMNVTANGRPILTDFDIVSDAGGSNIADVKVFKDISPGDDGLLHLRFLAVKGRACLSGVEILPGVRGRMRPVRLLARELPYFDKQGRLWGADRYFSGGRTVARSATVTGTADAVLFQSERYGNFTYTIPVAEGRYTVTLQFAETWFGPSQTGRGGAGSRLFDVLCNGVVLLKSFDIFKEARGEARAVEKTFRGLAPNAQGKLVLSFVPVKNYACLNALEVVDESR